MGDVVKAISHVVRWKIVRRSKLDPDQIEPPPKIGNRWQIDFLRGIGKRDDKFIMMLDVDRVFSKDEHALLENSGEISALLKE